MKMTHSAILLDVYQHTTWKSYFSNFDLIFISGKKNFLYETSIFQRPTQNPSKHLRWRFLAKRLKGFNHKKHNNRRTRIWALKVTVWKMFPTCGSSCPKVYCKKVFLKISQNSQQNTSARISFFNKTAVWHLQLYLKNLRHRWFLGNSAEFLRTPSL